ncbi:MAG TPA: response regulator transcription factor [Candidatus Stackebrandtia excrementipullorum]|nr:response regulator transcription factor [Candidatus Stackebrandtia excrementipullorum]
MIRLIVVDDHPVVRDGLTGMLATQPDFDIVGEAADGTEAITVASRTTPDVVITDLRMPPPSGDDLIRRLGSACGARILVLTTFDSDEDVMPALDAGATGYLLKDTPRAELFRAVRAAAAGESVLSPSVAARLIQQVRERRQTEQDALSEREREVLSLVSHGHTNRSVAAELFISEATVKTHLQHIFAKLEVNDRAAAVAEAINRGLLLSNDVPSPDLPDTAHRRRSR